MADEIPTTDPMKRGRSTSEFFTMALSVAGPLVMFLAAHFSELAKQYPEEAWIVSAASILAIAAGPVAYILGRSNIKAAQAKGDALVEAAGIQAGRIVGPLTSPTSSTPNPQTPLSAK